MGKTLKAFRPQNACEALDSALENAILNLNVVKQAETNTKNSFNFMQIMQQYKKTKLILLVEMYLWLVNRHETENFSHKKWKLAEASFMFENKFNETRLGGENKGICAVHNLREEFFSLLNEIVQFMRNLLNRHGLQIKTLLAECQ